MAVRALIGLQWGDEGKGKVVDAISEKVEMIVRAQGGANAGHTVKVGDESRVLHLIPSGMLYPHVQGVIANGVALDAIQLLKEIDALEASGVALRDRLTVSERAHLVLPYHKAMDAALEELRGGSAIGTTRRGIGPTYMDKAARTGIPASMLKQPDRLAERVKEEALAKRKLFAAVGVDEPDITADAILAELLPVAERLAPLVTNTVELVADAIDADREILIEGAQGSLLDLDLGTYPYVTSSSCHIGGLLAGSGIPPRAISSVIGVAKAYCTRVGRGPFPTEDESETGKRIGERGVEFGSTTGRPRRCGWLDLVALRFAVRTNGVDEIVLTKSDVLATIGEIKVAVAYEKGGERVERWPAGSGLDGLEAVYETFEGFEDDISDVQSWQDLPESLRALVARIEGFTGSRVTMISTGPERAQSVSCEGRAS